MYAIVEIAGFQYKIEKDQKLLVHRLEGEEGSLVSFDKVLLTQNGDTVQIGTPVINGVSVEAKILEHQKGDKVIVFKKKRRKGYQKQNGHRQYLTKIEIVSISLGNGISSKAESKKEAKEVKLSSDDLKIVEGIGPKAAEALVNAGVDNFKKLSQKTADELKQIITEASSKLAILDTSTWADQAKLADEGKFDELKTWQDQLKGGKIV
ncbi:MAG: 50S ribosomal protein L21 [Solirubrobacteraceae bacterium]